MENFKLYKCSPITSADQQRRIGIVFVVVSYFKIFHEPYYNTEQECQRLLLHSSTQLPSLGVQQLVKFLQQRARLSVCRLSILLSSPIMFSSAFLRRTKSGANSFLWPAFSIFHVLLCVRHPIYCVFKPLSLSCQFN